MRARKVRGSVYVVGGAAIAVTIRDERRTVDIDAVVSDRVVLEEAALLAVDEGIPRNWLNESAKPWIPPRPAAAIARLEKAGLTIPGTTRASARDEAGRHAAT